MSLSPLTISPRRSLLALAAGLLAAGILTAALASGASAATPTRHVSNDSGSKITIVDDESWPLSDEKGTFALDESKFAGLTVSPSDTHDNQQISRCVGDEVRVEVQNLAVHSYYWPGWVIVTIRARLYEGTNCQTTDFDGYNEKTFIVGPGETTTQTVVVNNDDEGGDSATVRFTMTNRDA